MPNLVGAGLGVNILLNLTYSFQKEKMKAMVDVANVKKSLQQLEAAKLQITYELEAEKETRIEKEGVCSIELPRT